MNNPTMLYKFPGVHLVDKEKFDYLIVDASDEVKFNEALATGWSKTPAEAKDLTLKVSDIAPKSKK